MGFKCWKYESLESPFVQRVIYGVVITMRFDENMEKRKIRANE